MLEGEHVGNGVDRRDGRAVGDAAGEQLRLAVLGTEVADAFLHRSGRMDERGTGEPAHLVGAPVLGRHPVGVHRRVSEHPGNQTLQRRSIRDQDHLAVGARVDQRRDQGAELQQRPIALDVLALDRVCDHRVQTGPEHRRLYRHVDELGLPRHQAAPVCDERGHRALRCSVMPGLRHADAHRPAVGVAVQRHHPAHGRERQIGGQVLRVGTALPERRDGDVDETRIEGAQGVEAERAGGHRSGRGVLEQKVGAADQAREGGAAARALEVERDAALAAVEGVETQALQALRQRWIERQFAA